MCLVVAKVCTQGIVRYPDFAWPPAREVRTLVESELGFRGRFMLRAPSRAGGHTRLHLGVEGGTVPAFGLWVESDPKYGPQRRAILDLADRNGLPSVWERQLATWQALRVALDPAAIIEQSVLVQWYMERLDELARAGVMELLPRLGRGAWSELGPTAG